MQFQHVGVPASPSWQLVNFGRFVAPEPTQSLWPSARMIFAAHRTAGDAVPSHPLAAEQLPSNLVNRYSCFNNH